jgi:hypothetical protein
MLSSVLQSKRTVRVNIEIMRTFARLRQLLAAHPDLARRLDALEGKYDKQFKVVFDPGFRSESCVLLISASHAVPNRHPTARRASGRGLRDPPDSSSASSSRQPLGR